MTDYTANLKPEPTNPTPRPERTTGRRWQDHVKHKSAWLLVIGVLLQGGFLLVTQRLITMGENQLNREREMLVTQHTEMVQTIRDQTIAIREQTAAIRELTLKSHKP